MVQLLYILQQTGGLAGHLAAVHESNRTMLVWKNLSWLEGGATEPAKHPGGYLQFDIGRHLCAVAGDAWMASTEELTVALPCATGRQASIYNLAPNRPLTTHRDPRPWEIALVHCLHPKKKRPPHASLTVSLRSNTLHGLHDLPHINTPTTVPIPLPNAMEHPPCAGTTTTLLR